MLRRAKRLQPTLNRFCSQFCSQINQAQFTISLEEWRQIEYLLSLTQPFFKFTSLLSQTKDVTIHLVFSIYNKLFDHLGTAATQLERKKVVWKQAMLYALEAAQEKLARYYADTDNIHDDLFAIGTIIAPSQKLQFFSGKSWNEPGKDWRRRYHQSFKNYFGQYKQRIHDSGLTSKTQLSAITLTELEMICASQNSQISIHDDLDELTKYLETSKYLLLLASVP
jgi:hypothetical protein